MTGGPEDASRVAPIDVQVRPARPERRVGQRAACRTRRGSSTTSALVKSMHTEAINHDPAITFIQTGAPARRAGRASGAWLAYGLGSENQDLPAFVVLISQGERQRPTTSRFYDRLWGSGLPADAATRACSSAPAATRSSTCPTPRGVDAATRRRRCSTTSAELNEMQHDESGDPEIAHADRAVRDGLPDAGDACRS